MLKPLTALLLLVPAAAQAFSTCKLTDIGGPGAHIAEEGSNPVVSGQWAYAAFAQDAKIVFLAASGNGATQLPLQTLVNGTGNTSNVRLAAAGSSVYVTWQQGGADGKHLWMVANTNHGKASSWNVPVDLGQAHDLQQIFADAGNVHLAYIAASGHATVVSSSDNGKTFGSPADLGESSGEIVITSHAKNVYASWEVGRTTKPNIGFGYSHDGGQTFTVSEINPPGSPEPHEPILSLNQKSGRLSLVWRDHDPTQGVYLQSLDNGQTWSTPLVIDTDSRQFMVQDNGPTIFISYLKEFKVDGAPDWQVQLAVSKDNGITFPFIQNLSGPTGVTKIVGDNSRPVPWSVGGKIVLTGVMADGAYIWSGDRGRITSDKVYLGPGELASPQDQVALWQEPEGVVTFAYCTDGKLRKR